MVTFIGNWQEILRIFNLDAESMTTYSGVTIGTGGLDTSGASVYALVGVDGTIVIYPMSGSGPGDPGFGRMDFDAVPPPVPPPDPAITSRNGIDLGGSRVSALRSITFTDDTFGCWSDNFTVGATDPTSADPPIWPYDGSVQFALPAPQSSQPTDLEVIGNQAYVLRYHRTKGEFGWEGSVGADIVVFDFSTGAFISRVELDAATWYEASVQPVAMYIEGDTALVLSNPFGAQLGPGLQFIARVSLSTGATLQTWDLRDFVPGDAPNPLDYVMISFAPLQLTIPRLRLNQRSDVDHTARIAEIEQGRETRIYTGGNAYR